MSNIEKLMQMNGIESLKKKSEATRINELEETKKEDAERIAELEAQNEMLTECIIEMANIIYA